MLRKIFEIAIVLLILNAAYQVGPPYWRYQRFKDRLQDVALQAMGKPDATIAAEVMELAVEYKIPLAREWITVSRSHDLSHTYIDATWAQNLAPVPGWTYTWIVAVKADGLHLSLPKPRGGR